MIGISNYDLNSINTLFSGLSNGSRTSNSGLLGINIVDYSAIRTGSYFKLMMAYYGGNDSASKIVETNKTTSTSTAKDDTKTLELPLVQITNSVLMRILLRRQICLW